MRRASACWWGVGLIWAFASNGWAAEAVPADAPPDAAPAPSAAEADAPEQEDPAPAAPAPAPPATDDAPPPAEVFVPTEAISEDIAVPFPVDI